MSDLRDLYQELILDHSKEPRNFGCPAGANCEAHGHNPLCGDKVRVCLKLVGDRVEAVGFEGSGCAISTAAASTMTQAIKGKSKQEIQVLFEEYHRMVTEGLQEGDEELLDKLAVFSGVSEFPMRVKCATLAWHTLNSALADSDKVVSTE